MTSIDITLALLCALLPTLGVLGFLFLDRRQTVRAELEGARLRRSAQQAERAEQHKRQAALTQAMTMFIPNLVELAERAFARPPGLESISNEDLAHEVDRRMSAGDWKHDNPFAGLDQMLHRLWCDEPDEADTVREHDAA